MPRPTDRCARCNHAFTFHGKKTDRPCKAMGCHRGVDRTPCPGFVERAPLQPLFQAPRA